MPVVTIALTTSPTATSSRPVVTMLRAPSASASTIARGPIGVLPSQDAAITARMLTPAA